MMHGFGYPYYHSGAGFGVNIFFNFLLWAALLFLAIVIIKSVVWKGGYSSGVDNKEGNAPDAIAILKTRYAKGEIDKKEYEEIKKEISKK